MNRLAMARFGGEAGLRQPRLTAGLVVRGLDFLISSVDALACWQERAADRRRLAALDERMLRDIGIDRNAAAEEADKPFWRA